MQHPDEGTIHAWLDGALSSGEASEIQSHVDDCAECKAAVAEARGLIAASSRIVSSLDIVPGGVIPARAPAKRWYSSTQLRAAAAVLFVAGASFLVVRERDGAALSDTASKVMTGPAAEPAPVATNPEAAAGASRVVPAEIERVAGPPAANSNTRSQDPEDRSARMQKSSRSDAEQRQDDVRAKVAPEPADVATTRAVAAGAPATPPLAAVAQAAAPELPTESARKASRDAASRAGFTATLKVAPVVVTAEKGLANQNVRIVRVDSTAETRVTHYVTDDGTQLTLIDTRLSPLSTATAMRRAEASVLKNDSSEVDETIQSIRWSNSEKGRAYVLTGRLSREKLEEARKAIEATTR